MAASEHNPERREEQNDSNLRRQPEFSAPAGLSCACKQAFSGRGQGCLPRLRELHRAYLAGSLPEALMVKIDRHLLQCRACENHWDALTSALEEGMLAAQSGVSSDDDEEACPREVEQVLIAAGVLPHPVE